MQRKEKSRKLLKSKKIGWYPMFPCNCTKMFYLKVRMELNVECGVILK